MKDKPRRLTKEQFIERVKDLYIKFNSYLYDENNVKIPFEVYYNDALKEYQKQQNMSDEELKKYRNIQFEELVNDVNQLTTDKEREKYKKEELQTLTEEDLIRYQYEKSKKEKS